MTDKQQAIPTDKDKEEQELEEAEAAYQEELGNPEEAAADMQAELIRTEREETAKEYQDILIAMGFTRYDNKEEGIACKLKTGLLQIGRTFNEKSPTGYMWVKCLEDSAFGKTGEFLKKDACMKIPQVKLFYDIRNGELPIPEATVQGKVVGKSDKAVQIQFEEFGQIRTEWWGFGALKKDKEGVHYVPASYSKETKNYAAKMQVPRDLILVNYEAELKDAETTTTTTDTGKHEEEVKKEEVAKGTVADMVVPKGTPPHSGEEYTDMREQVIIEDFIKKYVGILARVTESVAAEDRIPDREKGYAVKFIYYSVKGALENGKGGDHEEQV